MTDNPVKMILDQAFLRRPRLPITIRLRFRDHAARNEDDTKVPSFSFFTKEEADAFIAGVEAAVGWDDFKILEDGRGPR